MKQNIDNAGETFHPASLDSRVVPQDWCEHAVVVFMTEILSFLWSCNWTLCSRECSWHWKATLNRSWAMKSVGFVFQAALPSLRVVCGDLPCRILLSGLPCAEMGLLGSEPLNAGIIFTLFSPFRIFKNSFLWGPGRNFCLLRWKLRCSSSTVPVLNSRALHFTEDLGFLKGGISVFMCKKNQVCPLGEDLGGLSALPEQRHFLNNWAWFVCPVFCGVSLKCEQ